MRYDIHDAARTTVSTGAAMGTLALAVVGVGFFGLVGTVAFAKGHMGFMAIGGLALVAITSGVWCLLHPHRG